MTAFRLSALAIALVLSPATLLAAPPESPAGVNCPVLPATALDLDTLIRHVLCRHPETRLAWLNRAAQRERLGVANATYLPTLDLSASLRQQHGDHDGNNSAADLNLGWLLYDFGGRDASRRAAEHTLAALDASQADTVQTLFLRTVDAYFQWFAADAQLTAAQEAATAAEETLRAAATRQRIGSGTREEMLQAQTALSAARLTTLRQQGAREIARGRISVLLGLSVATPIALAAPAPAAPQPLPAFEPLLAQARTQRPDLQALARRIEAAGAERDQQQAAGRPTLSLFASEGVQDGDSGSNSQGGNIGLRLQAPLFTGFRQQHQVRLAERQLDLASTELQRQQQAAEEALWLAWQNLNTANATLTATDDLVTAASESLRGAQARYRAGVGQLINVLTAQSALADARQQQARARYDWQRARLTLVREAGQLSPAALAPVSETRP